jgi:hypothetical protein
MIRKLPIMTFQQAINEYYGGVHGVAKMSLPFTCKCGNKNYKKTIIKFGKQEKVEIPVMKLPDCFKHIRTVHRVRIEGYVEEKKEANQ